VWVVANFKETQLTHMKPGQDVEFEADSYPGVIFHGKVESISGATGARFALLPPDNSTGNFVKVTQRVPVKIVLSEAPDAGHPLRPG
jgi:membrane fusion protein (multidrug efflux system)